MLKLMTKYFIFILLFRTYFNRTTSPSYANNISDTLKFQQI